MIMQRNPEPVTMEYVTDRDELARAAAQREKFDRNAAWLQANAHSVYSQYRGRVICIAGGELFAGDSTEEALRAAKAKHPDDDGCFVRYISLRNMPRIYVYSRRAVPNGS